MTVVSRSESGLRGYQATLAVHGKKKMDEWRRTGGRRRNRTLLEIRAERREQEAAKKASARLNRRSSPRQEVRPDFDFVS